MTAYEHWTGTNNNQEVRCIQVGPLAGYIISAEPSQTAPYNYWLKVNAFRQRNAMDGCFNSEYRPRKPASREEMAVNMMRQASQWVERAPVGAMLIRSIAVLALFPGAAGAAERRCGWLENPTPANFYLRDRQGEWVMGEQGGYQAARMDELPDLTTGGWVRTNGNYGHGCACITGTFDSRSRQVIRADEAEAVPLARCKADRTLPSP